MTYEEIKKEALTGKKNGKQQLKGMIQRGLYKIAEEGNAQKITQVIKYIQENPIQNFEAIMKLVPAGVTTFKSVIPEDKQTPAYKEAMEMKRKADKMVREQRNALMKKLGLTKE